METKVRHVFIEDGSFVIEEPINVFDKKCPGECCLKCKYSELLSYRSPNGIGCWRVSDVCGEGDHRWCIDNGNEFKCTDWIDKEAKLTPNLDFWVCRCDWDDYFDFRIIADYGRGHVRVSFYQDEIIISDLFVRVDKRGERYGTALLDYVDELVQKFGKGKQASISALTNWEKEWYTRRGYKIIDKLDKGKYNYVEE